MGLANNPSNAYEECPAMDTERERVARLLDARESLKFTSTRTQIFGGISPHLCT